MNEIYTYDEALSVSTEYFYGDSLVAGVFVDKYALKDGDDIYESTPHDMHVRLAKEFARIDSEKYGLDYQERYEVYFDALNGFSRIVPGGSVMSAIGNKFQYMSASNCVVVEPPQDNIGDIFDTAKALAQLFKRRCVASGSKVITQEYGVLNIDNVEPGMHVLSYDINYRQTVFKKVLETLKTYVAPEDRVVLKYSNGTTLRTSKKHPILEVNNSGHAYIKAGDICTGSINIKPNISTDVNLFERNNLAWFIGAHMGDGSADKVVVGDDRGRYDRVRFRILGDNEDIISKYCEIHNNITGNNSNYHPSYRKSYKTACWEFSSSVVGNEELIKCVFDNQVGSKTYTGFIPQVIRGDRLWWSFLAGLIDADGTVKSGGQRIVIGICAHKIIDQLSAFLHAQGVSTHLLIRENVRPNEKPIYQLGIHYDVGLWRLISNLLVHPHKKCLLELYDGKQHSLRKPLLDTEFETIISKYESFKKDWSNYDHRLLAVNIYYLKKEKSPGIGKAFASQLVRLGIFEPNEMIHIMSRISLVSIEQDHDSELYFDIEVENTNNFYCGNFGLAVIHNCGVGTDLSVLRPEQSAVTNAAKTSSGAWSFAELYSNVTGMICQSGRRGACMLTLDVHHPDVLRFIKMKSDKTKVTNANVSIRLSDEFLKAVEKETDYELRWPCHGETKISQKVSAKMVWDEITKHAAEDGDPGIMFWDNICDNLPANNYEQFRAVTTNPCGEIPLSSYDSCRLISINLTAYVRNPFVDNVYFDNKAFVKDIRIAMQMIDNLVDLEIELIDRVKTVCDKGFETDIWNKLQKSGELGRRTGLGTHGLADMLVQMKISYDSDEALDIIDKIYSKLRNEAYRKSIDLAKERGPFPIFDWEKEKDNKFIKRLPLKIREDMQKHGRRNISILTQAPTGSVSIVSKLGNFDAYNVSSGIEPIFQISYIRKRKVDAKNGDIDHFDEVGNAWREYRVFHSNAKCYLDMFGIKADTLPEYFITSDNIDWTRRVKLQGVEQKYIDHSISSTINLPRNTSSQVIADIYWSAWKNGLKGITVYVEGTKGGVLVSDTDNCGRPTKIITSNAPKRPKELKCEIHYATIKGVRWAVLIGLLHNDPYEMFMGMAERFNINKPKDAKIVKVKKGIYNLLTSNNELLVSNIVKTSDNEGGAWTSRVMSMALRHGIPVDYLVEQLSKDGSVVDINNVLARLLRRYMRIRDKTRQEICPQCGGPNLIYSEGCKKCGSCSWTGCG
ncbi:hypothetical protein LCGC14_0427110 [marine sediment metagenome]|uniref:ribonucleoside-diphosphate reductase n=1 Tax=marine sediment metagenome TaxID=412755 RepID=A0A0F9SVH0_9ZZZZ